MHTLFRLLYQPYKWLILAPLIGIFTLVLGLLSFLLVFFVSPRAGSLMGSLWGRLICYATPVRVRVSGRRHIDPNQSYVIVCNHQSNYDILALYGWLGIDIKWVMKKELRKVPIVGFCCERIGHIYVDRSNTDAAIRSIEAAKRRVVDGTSVIFFPEGTRSRDGRLGIFKKGAFRFAAELDLPVLPVTICGSYQVMPPHTYDLFPGRIDLTIHAPVQLPPGTGDLRAFMARVRETIDPDRHIVR